MRLIEKTTCRPLGWRWLCLMALVVPILILSGAGCKDKTQSNTTNPVEGSGSSSDHEIAAYDMVVSPGANDHEIGAKEKKINLNSQEMEGLQHSLDQLKGSGSAASHVDVDVQGGKLTFKADNDASHASGATKQIKVGAEQTPVKAALSPAALDYLQKH